MLHQLGSDLNSGDWITNHFLSFDHLTSSHRMPYVQAKILPIDNRRTFKHTFRFLRVWPGALSTRHVCHCASDVWRVYTQLFLGVRGVTVLLPRTEGTANNEWVHSLCWFLPNTFIQDLFLWHTSQDIVKMDLYPLSRGIWSLSPVCRLFDWALVDNRPLRRSLPTV